MSFCGSQYTGRGCACHTQPIPGITPMASLPVSGSICSYIDKNFLYGCDAGCCPGGCPTDTSTAAASTSADAPFSTTWTPLNIFLIVLGILYCVLLVLGVVSKKLDT